MSFIRKLLVIGSILVGIGILSFIAINWSALPKYLKISLIIVGIMGTYFAGWKYEAKYPKTSRSLYYIGILIYGAGIFLIKETFHIGHEFSIWALGILPLAIYLRDKWIVLLFIYFIYRDIWWMMYLAIPVIYLLNRFILNRSKMIFFFQNLLIGYIMIVSLMELGHAGMFILAPILLFIYGIILVFLTLPHYRTLLQWQSALFYGLNGIVLTFPDYWHIGLGVTFSVPLHDENSPILNSGIENEIAFIFAPLFALLLVYLIKKGHLVAILIFCMLIIRYYVAFAYEELPKLLFFILGGLLLLGSGYWIERNRRKGKHTNAKEA